MQCGILLIGVKWSVSELSAFVGSGLTEKAWGSTLGFILIFRNRSFLFPQKMNINSTKYIFQIEIQDQNFFQWEWKYEVILIGGSPLGLLCLKWLKRISKKL